jgi:hypothetical protein
MANKDGAKEPKRAGKAEAKAAKKVAKHAARGAKAEAKAVARGAKAQAKQAPKPGGASLKTELVALERLRVRYPENTPDEVDAFTELATDERRSELGGQTKSADVLSESIVVAQAIDGALKSYGARVSARYPVARFRFLLDAIDALGEAMTAPVAGAGRGDAAATADELEGAARVAKTNLVGVMRAFAGQRDAERTALSAASSGGDDKNALAESIGALGELARKWLARADAKAKIQLASAGLTAELVDGATAAARAYASGSADVVLAGRRRGNDSPLVNQKEGAVLVEIIEADHIFDALAAQTRNIISRLPLGKTLSRMARSRPKGPGGGGGSGGAPT